MFEDKTAPRPVQHAGTLTARQPDPPQPLERLEAEICRLAGHLAAATCRFLILLADFDARRGWAEWDMSSCAAWLSWKCQMSSGTAREHVRVARALPQLPVIRDEFAAGRFSYAKVRALTRIATPDSDADLAEMAAPMTANQLERFARAHRKVTQAEDEQSRLSRRLTWLIEDDGSLSLRVRLPPEDGAAVLAALRAAVQDSPPVPGEDVSAETPPAPEPGGGLLDPGRPRPTSTSLADALVDIAEAYSSSQASNAHNPDTYQVIVHADLAALTGEQDGRCHIEDGPAISPESLRMIACSSVLRWMSHDERGDVLNVGRRRREPTPALRRALAERDKCRCRFPGCHRRATQAHHIQWWMDGGITSLDNLISLCRYHHRLIHKAGHTVATRADGGFAFFRPDRSPIPNSPPLPAPHGQLHDAHDAEITPETIIPAWYGERLDLDFALTVLFANQELRAARG